MQNRPRMGKTTTGKECSNEMTDVFLSYRRETGSEFCSFLSLVLKQEGYDVFFDHTSMRQGPFDTQIDNAIAECTFLLAVLAPRDLDRCVSDPEHDWILHEVGLAQSLGKIVIPVVFKAGFQFPDDAGIEVLKELSRETLCDLSGPDAATLIRTRLFEFMQDSPASRVRDEYNCGLLQESYQEWELQTLQTIYSDFPFIHMAGKTYPVTVIEGSDKVQYPFPDLTRPENLMERTAPVAYQESDLYRDFRKIVGPNIHFPDLYGFANEGLLLDASGKIEGFRARPRTYKETVYTSHILHYELWRAFQRLGKDHPATLDDLPLRKRIHAGQTNQEVLLSGKNRSCLCDVSIATVAYDSIEDDYDIAIATRSTHVACHPGYLSIVPSGGFELYELETKQDNYNISSNFKIISALFREYIEELFGDTAFEQPTGDDDLRRLYRNEHIKALRKGMGSTYFFEFLGVTFDLTSLRPTFAFLLRIDDPDFLYDNQIRKNSENSDLRFVSLSRFEDAVRESRRTSPLMPESAGVYGLLKQSPLFREIRER